MIELSVDLSSTFHRSHCAEFFSFTTKSFVTSDSPVFSWVSLHCSRTVSAATSTRIVALLVPLGNSMRTLTRSISLAQYINDISLLTTVLDTLNQVFTSPDLKYEPHISVMPSASSFTRCSSLPGPVVSHP